MADVNRPGSTGVTPADATDALLSRVARSVEWVLELTGQPGSAIAIVGSGELLFTKGFGWRDLEKQLPMSSATAFPIASTAKSMNATLLAMLAGEGRLSWDVPVKEYIPELRLCDPVARELVTLRDLVSMRTGLPRHDWAWLGYPRKRRELIEAIGHLEFSAGFRERFQYNNLSVTLAGHVAERVTGRSWEDLIRARIFQPLGMAHTVFSRPTMGEVTRCYHQCENGELVAADLIPTEVTAPSGGAIWSTICDMARWVSCNLGSGLYGGRQIVPAQALRELSTPHVVIGSDLVSPSPTSVYGLGWFIDHHRGSLRVSHAGYLHNVSSDVSLFPEAGIGIVSFVNLGSSVIARHLNQHLFDVMCGVDTESTVIEALAAARARRDIVLENQRPLQARPGSEPSHSLECYVGSYVHPGYGTMKILLDGELWLQRGPLRMPLRHLHYDAWVAEYGRQWPYAPPNPYNASNPLMFATNKYGEIEGFSFGLDPVVAPIQFDRMQD